MLSRLFQPFEQESASTARKYGGSGLGLSITKRLVEMMGGSIRVESEQNKGTVFTVALSFGAEEDEAATPGAFSDIHALVEDGDSDSGAYTGLLLDRLGVRHRCMANADAALAALRQAADAKNPYALCLADWKVSGMASGTLLRQLRAFRGQETFRVFVTAYDLRNGNAPGQSPHADRFLQKPLFLSTLSGALLWAQGKADMDQAKMPQCDIRLAGRRVLIAEDIPLNREVVVKLLKMAGIDTACAADGKEAVALFEQSAPGQYDGVLMDINMPVMDGYAATAAIRRSNHPDAQSIPIYAMTANAFAEDVTAALNAGMNGHIAKPIETTVLYRTLASAFAAKARAAEPPDPGRSASCGEKDAT